MSGDKYTDDIPDDIHDEITVGEFTLSFFDGTEAGGIWLENRMLDEAGQFTGTALYNALKKLWDENF